MQIQIKKRLFRQPILEVIFDRPEMDNDFSTSKFTYKLLKDLPFLKAGTLITYHEDACGMVTTRPLKMFKEFEGHYLDWLIKEVHGNPSEYRDFIKLIR